MAFTDSAGVFLPKPTHLSFVDDSPAAGFAGLDAQAVSQRAQRVQGIVQRPPLAGIRFLSIKLTFAVENQLLCPFNLSADLCAVGLKKSAHVFGIPTA